MTAVRIVDMVSLISAGAAYREEGASPNLFWLPEDGKARPAERSARQGQIKKIPGNVSAAGDFDLFGICGSVPIYASSSICRS